MHLHKEDNESQRMTPGRDWEVKISKIILQQQNGPCAELIGTLQKQNRLVRFILKLRV
jgi:hypothetical protein